MPLRMRQETFGRLVWCGQQTGHNGVGQETGHNARFQLSDGVPCRAEQASAVVSENSTRRLSLGLTYKCWPCDRGRDHRGEPDKINPSRRGDTVPSRSPSSPHS